MHCALVWFNITRAIRECFQTWRFCRKTRFEASWVVFWSLSCYKELKLTTNRFTGRTLRGLLIQMQNISLRSSGILGCDAWVIHARFARDEIINLAARRFARNDTFFTYCGEINIRNFRPKKQTQVELQNLAQTNYLWQSSVNRDLK